MFVSSNLNLRLISSAVRKVSRIISSTFKTTPGINENRVNFIENVFQKDFTRKALVSFIVSPFLTKSSFFYHTNTIESVTICEVLDELGFNVDVADYDAFDLSFHNEYDLVFGFGQPIEELLLKYSRKPFKLILYRNGADSLFSDKVSLKRLDDFRQKHGQIFLESAPLYPYSLRSQVWFADLIIVLGNNFVANTFQGKTLGKISSLNLMYFDVGPTNLDDKAFETARRNFIWFGSRGAIRKGLDIALDFFRNRSELNLFICGLNDAEVRFIEYYEDVFKLPNIHNLGFVAMESPEFKNLLKKCGAVVFPTIWEGGGGAVVNLVATAGLVPIVTESIGLDFENNEFLIAENSVESLEEAIDRYLQLSESELKSRSTKLQKLFREKHHLSKFRESLKLTVFNNL